MRSENTRLLPRFRHGFPPAQSGFSTGNLRTIRLHWLKVNEIVRIFCFMHHFWHELRLEMVCFRPWSVEMNYAEIDAVERKSGKWGKSAEIRGFFPQCLWKTKWIMWNNSRKNCGISCGLCIAYSNAIFT